MMDCQNLTDRLVMGFPHCHIVRIWQINFRVCDGNSTSIDCPKWRRCAFIYKLVVQLYCLSTVTTINALSVHGRCLFVCNQRAYADHFADAVGRLLISQTLETDFYDRHWFHGNCPTFCSILKSSSNLNSSLVSCKQEHLWSWSITYRARLTACYW